MGEALKPLERVDSGIDLPTGIRSRLEPQLAASDPRHRLVFAQPRIVPAPERRLLVGDAQRPRRANVERPRPDLPMSINAFSALFFLLALYSAYARRLWRLIAFGGFALAFKRSRCA